VAKSIAAVLGDQESTRTLFLMETAISFLVLWSLAGLRADAFDEKYEKWRYADLNYVPAACSNAVSATRGQQFTLLKGLMSRSDVSEVINACDAGREGELIFRTVLQSRRMQKSL
jgi:DNA topoisomerase-3